VYLFFWYYCSFYLVGGKFDNGGRFDLRLPYADQGYVSDEADVMGKLSSFFGGGKKANKKENVVPPPAAAAKSPKKKEQPPPLKKKGWPW
jgi:hypothetical protein